MAHEYKPLIIWREDRKLEPCGTYTLYSVMTAQCKGFPACPNGCGVPYAPLTAKDIEGFTYYYNPRKTTESYWKMQWSESYSLN